MVKTETEVKEATARLQLSLDTFLPFQAPEEWEQLLTKFMKELHEDHFLCMAIKRVLLSMYGARKGYRLEQLPQHLLVRKIELCRNYVSIFSRLEPGYRKWKGEVLEELVGALTVSTNQDMENNNISKIEYMMKIKEVIGMVKEAAKCRQFEKSKSVDNGLYMALAKSVNT